VIVLPDADVEAAIAGAAGAIFFKQGQVCSAGSRLLRRRGTFRPQWSAASPIRRRP